MSTNSIYQLPEPLKIRHQKWKENTVPIVSISCITYNHENYIKDAIEGFLNQETTFPVEILIHDDASDDSTVDIIRKYEIEYPWIIKPIYQEFNQYSKGIKVNITFNYPRTKGKYIAYCEGDDYWIDVNKLQVQVEFLERNIDVGIVFTYSEKIDNNGFVLEKFDHLYKIKYTQYDILTGKKYQTRTASAVVKTELLDYESTRIGHFHNGDTIIKILATRGKYGVVLPLVTSRYRIHPGGIWSNANKIEKRKKKLSDWLFKLRYASKYNRLAIIPICYRIFQSFLVLIYHVIKR